MNYMVNYLPDPSGKSTGYIEHTVLDDHVQARFLIPLDAAVETAEKLVEMVKAEVAKERRAQSGLVVPSHINGSNGASPSL